MSSPSNARAVMRSAALIAALLLLLALVLRWQNAQARFYPGTPILLFVALGFAAFAALVWNARRRLWRVESDRQQLALDYCTIIDAAPQGLIVTDEDGVIGFASRRAEELFGYAPGELAGIRLERLVPERLREEHVRKRNLAIGQLAGDRIHQDERMLALRKDGSEFLANLNIGSRSTSSGPALSIFVEDITDKAAQETELQRIHRALRLLTEAGQVMRRAVDPVELMQAICRIIIDVGGYRFAFIGYAEDDAGKSIYPVAWSGVAEGYLENMNASWGETPEGRGPAGQALCRQAPVIVRPDLDDTPLPPWRERQLAHGFVSVAAFPLRITGQHGAVVAIHAASASAFGEEECTLLGNLVTDIGHGIDLLRAACERVRSETALQRSEVLLERAQQIAHVGSWEWDLVTRKMRWSSEMFRIFGYAPGEFEPRQGSVLTRTHADDGARVRQDIAAIVSGRVSSLNIDHRVIWPDGNIHHVHMMCEAEQQNGRVVRLVGSAQNVTNRIRRETELKRTNRALQMHSAVSHAMREAASEADLLQRVCDAIVQSGGYLYAGITGKPDASSLFRLRAGAGEPGARTPYDEGGVSADEHHPGGQGIVARAWREGRPSLIYDVRSDPRYSAWRDKALSLGVHACGAYPLIIDHQCEGVLALYAHNDTFGEAESLRIGELAGDVANAMVMLRADLARNEAEAALRRNEALLGRAESLAHVGSWEWDMRSETLQWSDEIYHIFGYEPHEVEPSNTLALKHIHPDDRSLFREKITAVHNGDVLSAEMDYRILPAHGEMRWVHTIAEMEYHDTGPLRITGVVQDISERKGFEQKLADMASFDNLTGLPNRNLLNDRLGQALAHASRSESLMAVGFVDLDRFKLINDTLGHDAGDELLKEIARRLSGSLRRCDTVARQGGDEFVVVLTDLAHTEDANVVAQKLLDALTPAMTLCGREIVPGASLGFAVYPRDGKDLQTLLMAADKAMYAAKQAGRGQFRFYDAEMNRAAADWLEVGAELHHALERGQYELHYQPKLDLREGTITGVEALLRWRSPEHGLVPPNKFIPVLEETGLILEVGEWVIARACRQWRLWREEGLPAPRIAVNLSPRQFQQADLAERIRALIDQPDFLPEYLELEITESMVMHNLEHAIATLDKLRQIGVHLAIDDFGTGHSSLAALKRFPVDCLKVDRSFVCDIPADTDDMIITRSVIALAHSMGLSVVAEGVETEEQRLFLVESGCDEMQGFLFSRPLPADELARLLREDASLIVC